MKLHRASVQFMVPLDSTEFGLIIGNGCWIKYNLVGCTV